DEGCNGSGMSRILALVASHVYSWSTKPAQFSPRRIMRHDRSLLVAGLSALIASAACFSGSSASGTAAGNAAMPPSATPAVNAESMERAGEYLTIVGSCNDCHTQGWVESKGKIPPADRFAGLDVGFRGEWGTSYGKNLRTVVQRQ